MGESNLAPVEEQAMVNNDVSYELVDTADEGGHKVLFYIMAGIICLSGIGVPILVWRLMKRKKQLKQAQEQLAALQAPPATPAPTAEATEAPAATTPETK